MRSSRSGLAPDVHFHRVPVPFLQNAENFMRTYYALETMGKVEAMQRKVFSTIHGEHNFLDKPAAIAALMAKNGIDSAKFLAVFNSFSVAASVNRAKKLMEIYNIQSVPALVVQGKYITSPAATGGLEGATVVADYLIAKVRKG